LTTHIHEMALKSPHPIRIGDVEYKRVRVLQGRVDADPEDGRAVLAPRGLMRQDSLPLVATTTGGRTADGRTLVHAVTSSPININQRIGQNLLQKQKQDQGQKVLEKDPQEEPPAWNDFIVAIFFIFFGVLAFVAGILSLTQG
jgi:hypothetical protein